MDSTQRRLLAYHRLISKAVSLRKESGKTMQKVADDAGIAQPNIARLEKMTHEVKVSTLLAYLDSFDCTLEIVPRNRKPRVKMPKVEQTDSLEKMTAKQFIRLVLYAQKLAYDGGIEIVPDDEE